MQNKKNLIISCILTLIMCASLLTGATYALFTSENTKNIAVTSGSIDVVANIENLTLTSYKAISPNGIVTDDTNIATNDTFANGGTASIQDGSLTLTNVVPGDMAKFDIKIINNSNVLVKYRTSITVTNDDGLFSALNVVIGDTTLNSNITYTDWANLKVNSEPIVLACSVQLPTSAIYTYMNKTCSIAFTVEAVQGNVEYETAVVKSTDELKSALENTNAPTKLVLEKGNYDKPAELHQSMVGKDVIISGTKDTVIDFSSQVGVNGVADLEGTTLTLDGVTVKWSDNNEGYQGLKNPAKVVYKNCTIIGTQFMYCGADFINCTFETDNGYAVYTRASGDYTFTDCTFKTGGRAIMLYHDAVIEVNITVTNCTFSDDGTYTSKPKAAIETGDFGSASKFNIVINNCETTMGFETNNSTSNLWGNKESMPTDRLNVILDGKDVY